MVFVVNEQAIRRREDEVVHPEDVRPGERASGEGIKGVEGPVGAAESPIVAAEAVEIVKVNDSEAEFFDVNEADVVAEAEAVIKNHDIETQPGEPVSGFELNVCHFSHPPSFLFIVQSSSFNVLTPE